MTQYLILRLAEPANWLVADDSGGRLGPIGFGSLADAAPLARDRRVIVLAPATDVALAEPDLPVRAGAKLAQVVPFALEEQLAGDIDECHFAAERPVEGQRTLVAAIGKHKLEDWLSLLRGAGIEPDALIPETLCLPQNPGKTVVLLERGRLLMRRPGELPFGLDVEPLSEAFALAGLEGGTEHVQCYVAESDWDLHRDLVETLREVTGSLDVQLLADGALPLLAQPAVTGAPLSLLSGAYASRRSGLGGMGRWRLVAGLAAAALLLQVGIGGYQLWSLGRAESQLDRDIESTFRAALPDVERIVDPRAQFEGRLRGGTTAQGGLLPTLAAVGGAMTGGVPLTVNSLNYQPQGLDLTLTAPTAEAFTMLSRNLGQQGLAVDVRSTSSVEGGIEGRVQVRPAGAT